MFNLVIDSARVHSGVCDEKRVTVALDAVPRWSLRFAIKETNNGHSEHVYVPDSGQAAFTAVGIMRLHWTRRLTACRRSPMQHPTTAMQSTSRTRVLAVMDVPRQCPNFQRRFSRPGAMHKPRKSQLAITQIAID